MTPQAQRRAASGPDFVYSRTLDAPRALVWAAHTDCEHLKHWWGPKGFTVTSCKLDLRPGGVFHYGLRSPTGQEVWGRFVFREIVPPERLVFVLSFSDGKGNVVRHPFSEDWPLHTLSTLTFEERDGRTTVTVRWAAYEATQIEQDTFDAGHDSMRQGWGGTIDKLVDYLKNGPE